MRHGADAFVDNSLEILECMEERLFHVCYLRHL
jgi:hypothetical protein